MASLLLSILRRTTICTLLKRLYRVLARGVGLRRPTHMLRAQASVARIFLSALLACVSASSVIPSGGASASAAHSCPMPCCQGASRGDDGGGSCPLDLHKKAKQSWRVKSDPVCGADKLFTRGVAPRARQHRPEHAASHAQGGAQVEHNAGVNVSARNTPADAASVSAALSKPCHSDCGAALNALTQLRRTRDAATLSFKLRPPPPAVARLSQNSFDPAKTSSQTRGHTSPRAPPFNPRRHQS